MLKTCGHSQRVSRITLSRDVSEARATCFQHGSRRPLLAGVEGTQGPPWERTLSPGPVVCPVSVTSPKRKWRQVPGAPAALRWASASGGPVPTGHRPPRCRSRLSRTDDPTGKGRHLPVPAGWPGISQPLPRQKQSAWLS